MQSIDQEQEVTNLSKEKWDWMTATRSPILL